MKEWIDDLKWEIKDKISKFYTEKEPYFTYPTILKLIAEIERLEGLVDMKIVASAGDVAYTKWLKESNAQLRAVVEAAEKVCEEDRWQYLHDGDIDELRHALAKLKEKE